MHSVMVFGGGAFGTWLGHEGRALLNKISDFMKETPQSSTIPSTMWGYSRKTAILEPENGALPDTESAGAWVWLPSLENCEK